MRSVGCMGTALTLLYLELWWAAKLTVFKSQMIDLHVTADVAEQLRSTLSLANPQTPNPHQRLFSCMSRVFTASFIGHN